MRRGYWARVWREFRKNRLAVAGLCVVGFLLAVAALAPLLANDKPYIYITGDRVYFPLFAKMFGNNHELKDADLRKDSYRGFKIFPPVPYSYSEYDLNSIVAPPGPKHLLGTDEQGRDLFARMVHGSRVSILIGFIAVAIYVAIGIIIGSIAGYYGGVIDMIISRFIEIVMCFPTFFLILTILALVEPNLVSVMVVIGLTSWTGIARIVRGEFLKLREADFVVASRAIGARDPWIIARHVLPNSLAPVLVSATFGIASTILIESSLSFLGFGVQPPTPSWGDILSQSRIFMDFAWWLTLIPGFAIFITITAYNLVGEGLQDAIDPKSISK
ncbi:MAG TPA: ABC transporter permease [Spirochaetota bacterium]|nr:ABC transporter permease [Spirochaetota bacterium]HOD15642.1 ABC transporter permease [Spirochaetota bacterium]HPG51667.1 ABC transporter permease [Spirochaetota bacterium]HPN13923.1 ABC transporter permease [Spirochaetota bacterium]HQL80979.1 ABC transporter permease [Spirochaetota bacterium]